MKSLIKYLNEKLLINKNFKDEEYALNNILKGVWNKISSDNKYNNNEIDADSVFVEAADVSSEHDYKLSDIDGAIDVTRSFKKCKTIYMLDSRHDNVLLDNLFLTLRKNKIELTELEWNDSNSYSFEYKETDDFIILVCGGNNYYTFIGKWN